MVRPKKADDNVVELEQEDISVALIKQLNKEFGQRVAYNLSEDDAPTIVKRWISTGSRQLDYMIRNAVGGGYPEGRIIEVAGMPSTGKSHLALAAAVNVQKMGGLVVYIDTENATSLSKLSEMGVNIKKQFVFCETSCTEEVFQIVENTIVKAKAVLSKNVPILVVWDSLAATSPKAELDGDYDQNSVGLQARVISKSLRKITGIIGHNNVTFMIINQLRAAIGVMHGDPLVTPGGSSTPFHASVRVRLSSGTQIKNKDGEIIGVHVIATIKKNKVAPPHKKCEFNIIFGYGIEENEYIFDKCRAYCKDKGAITLGDESVSINGDGAWKELIVSSASTGEVKLEKKFYKTEFGEVSRDEKYKKYVDAVIDAAYVSKTGKPSNDSEDNEITEEAI